MDSLLQEKAKNTTPPLSSSSLSSEENRGSRAARLATLQAAYQMWSWVDRVEAWSLHASSIPTPSNRTYCNLCIYGSLFVI